MSDLSSKVAKVIYQGLGWRFENTLPKDLDRCVMVAAPHTSNWDFFYAILAFEMVGLPVRFTIKDSYIKGPFGGVITALGGLGINREPRKPGEQRRSMVEVMTELFMENDKLIMLVTPEGTRSRVEHWKTGFYHVALNAKVPLVLSYLDYPKKLASTGLVLYPTGDMETDMKAIMEFYKNKTAKFPEKFSLDQRYISNQDRQAVDNG